MRTATLLLAIVVAGCLAPEPPPVKDPDDAVPGVRFLVVGDMGTGAQAQFDVAEAMVDVCKRRGCDLVLATGDNIYETGVSSPDDPQFVRKFEDPYRPLALPFYLVLGNHDNGGNGLAYEPERGDHQVAYTYRSDRPSAMWNMPARYYAFQVEDVAFFGLDSGPAVTHLQTLVLPGEPAAQQAWVETALAASDASWRLAFAHHPYISNGAHGDAGAFDGVPGAGLGWKDLLESSVCPKVDAFFAGHDHDLQWLESPDCDAMLFVSGAGAKARGRGGGTHAAVFEQYGELGFWWVQVQGDTFTAAAFDRAGKHLFERVVTKT